MPEVHSRGEGCLQAVDSLPPLVCFYTLWFFLSFFIFPYFLIGSANSVDAINLWVLRNNPLLLGLSLPARSSDVGNYEVSEISWDPETRERGICS